MIRADGGDRVNAVSQAPHHRLETNRMIVDRLFAERIAVCAASDESWLPQVPAGGAVCALTDEDDRLIQLLATQSLRRMLRNRLILGTEPRRSRRADLSAIVARVWWQPTGSVFETDWTYLGIARQLWPRDYRSSLAFGPVWFARIDFAERFPRWTPSTESFGLQVRAAGPFITRKQAARYIHHLEELFELCRYHHVLVQYPHGQPCAYLDMGKCPAPCNGSIGLDQYRSMLQASAAFALDDSGALRERLHERMAQASSSLQFELAQQLKDSLTHVDNAECIKGRLAVSQEALNYLIVQSGVRRDFVRAFFVRAGCIDPGGEVHLDQLETVVGSWIATMSSDKAQTCAEDYRAECVWLLGRYLGKKGKFPGAWFEQPDFTDERLIVGRVRECFCTRRSAKRG